MDLAIVRIKCILYNKIDEKCNVASLFDFDPDSEASKTMTHSAILLCAGYATRMYPLTFNFPKPLLPVAGKALLDYLMEQLLCLSGISGIHVVTNDRYFAHFQQWRNRWLSRLSGSIQLRIHNDGTRQPRERLGAVADLKWFLDRAAPPGRLLVAAGDNIFDFDLAPLWHRWLEEDVHRVIALSEVRRERLKKTAVLRIDQRGRVKQLLEKPSRPISNLCCPPLYFLLPSAADEMVNYLNGGGNRDALGSWMDHLSQCQPVYAWKLMAGRWEIGSIDSYREAEAQIVQGMVVGEPLITRADPHSRSKSPRGCRSI